jgi:hypothetical protein
MEAHNMLIPEIFYGSYKDVQLQIKKMIKKIIRGGSGSDVNELVSNLVMMDTMDNRDLIITNRNNIPGSSRIPYFMMFMLQQEVSTAGYADDLPKEYRPSRYDKPLSREQEEALFLEIIQQPWGLICVISERAILLGRPFTEELQRTWKDIYCKKFLEQLLIHWGTIQEVGERYVDIDHFLFGIRKEHGPLTSSGTMLACIFSNLGLEDSEIDHLLLCQDVPQLIHKAQKLSGWR